MTENTLHLHPDDTSELLSGLLDDALDTAELRRARELVASCPGCKAEFAELQAMHELLRDLPLVAPPRSLALDPAQFARPARAAEAPPAQPIRAAEAPPARPTRRLPWRATLAWSSALTVLLVAVLFASQLGGHSSATSTATLSAPQAPSVAEALPTTATAAGGALNATSAPEAAIMSAPAATSGSEMRTMPAPSAESAPPAADVAPTASADAVGAAAQQLQSTTAVPAPTDVIRATDPISRNQTTALQPADLPTDEPRAAAKSAPPEAAARPAPSGERVGIVGLTVLLVVLAAVGLITKRQGSG